MTNKHNQRRTGGENFESSDNPSTAYFSGTCWNCGGKNHKSTECKKPARNGSEDNVESKRDRAERRKLKGRRNRREHEIAVFAVVEDFNTSASLDDERLISYTYSCSDDEEESDLEWEFYQPQPSHLSQQLEMPTKSFKRHPVYVRDDDIYEKYLMSIGYCKSDLDTMKKSMKNKKNKRSMQGKKSKKSKECKKSKKNSLDDEGTLALPKSDAPTSEIMFKNVHHVSMDASDEKKRSKNFYNSVITHQKGAKDEIPNEIGRAHV